jgi:hypothetical protein
MAAKMRVQMGSAICVDHNNKIFNFFFFTKKVNNQEKTLQVSVPCRIPASLYQRKMLSEKDVGEPVPVNL